MAVSAQTVERRVEKSAQAFRTISEVATELDVPQHVLRFWESKFSQVRPLKRGGGRRYYRPEDIDLLRRIRTLLYDDGYTIKGVQRCLDCGFALHDIAVISLRGRESSALQHLDQLGPWRTRHFTGAFDEGGDAKWTDGDLLLESVRRFKGQAAVAVVLTECELADLGELNRRLLFVGLTRARVHLEWVVSKTTEALLEQVLQG